ncbi:MAG: Peptidase dimerization [Planctomycetota bacterium]|nr:Peptidase dimerization [Planctomycetota bacterium]MDQ1284533.1 Peptidase dimerization [Patescibacteria group bacterium]
MTPIEKLLVELLKIPSVTGQEKEIGRFLVSELRDFKIEKQLVEKDRFNVIARKGDPQIHIVVHMDTVPGVIPVKITKDKIFGRGAIDNKGNIAGAIMAARKMENIGLIFTVGEEVDFAGAKKIKIKKGKFIVMEPTKMKFLAGQRGAIAFDVIAKGVQTHSSLDFKKEDSAVYNLLNTLSELYKKGWTAFNAVIFEGGEKDSIVPPRARAEIFVRPKDLVEYRNIKAELGRIKGKNIEVRMKEAMPPCFSGILKNGKVAPFFSEMFFFKNSVLFGVGDIANAHTADEFVSRKELNRLEGELIELAKKLEA